MSKRAIIVGLEGLGTNALGAYGGPWVDTPCLNDFAAKGVVADQFWLDTDDLSRLLRSLWFGWHAQENPSQLGRSLMSILGAKGIRSELSTDVSKICSYAGASDFSNATLQECDRLESAMDPSSCWMAEWIESSIGDWLSREDRPELLWLHGQGWLGPWDAPYQLREGLTDEEDPDPPHELIPPVFEVTSKTDPDLVFGWNQAAAAQSYILDAAWDFLNETLRQFRVDDDCLLVLLGMSGYPLGEHRWVGKKSCPPYAELVHVPCILKPGNRLKLGKRFSHLSQPPDLWRTIIDWFDASNEILEPEPVRRTARSLWSFENAYDDGDWLASTVSQHGTFLRSKYWGMLEKHDDSTSSESDASVDRELFVQPEDRWQQNDIASRAEDVFEAAIETRQSWDRWLQHETCMNPPPIANVLREPPR